MRGGPVAVLVQIGVWVLLASVVRIFPDNLSFATSVVVMALFAMSLDLILGYAGIISLGHAVFFGIGAYAAGWIALGGWHEPISGLLLAGAAAALAALGSGPLLLRFTGLPLIMATFVTGAILYEAANKTTTITGGDNGLTGFEFAPVLGLFRWSVFSQVEYLYALTCLCAAYNVSRRLVASPFGLALQGIRENAARMTLVGAPVRDHLLRIYAFSAFLAGLAGALATETTRFVSLGVFSVSTSIDVVVMLVLGGVSTLYGPIVGASVYMIVHHVASEWNPYHWMFIIGFMLLFVVRVGRGGIVGITANLAGRALWRSGGGHA
jgi:branched-chain amino acid transport system permease protein